MAGKTRRLDAVAERGEPFAKGSNLERSPGETVKKETALLATVEAKGPSSRVARKVDHPGYAAESAAWLT